ncbi:hypothetical protein J0X19_14765 [Hymenobacter sp. BT186]|uniref:Uncharacterized protein n=1 Tax=Hymenobacter telluris TaxID=2816474 RepID=A0A939EXY8_9BACT|nr:hypothetical protein [Hymenobacter telluris]MBO0359221.1 hypothetical protein [Hymenobacter telluris]MBW3375247.1 hypothetical protein [Hymenobacter norwichensis]
MKRLVLFVVGSISLVSFGHQARAQRAPADTSASVAAGGLQRQYNQLVRNAWSLYNGPEYIDYVRSNTNGHRFFGTKDEQLATVTYAGTTYANVLLRYDLIRGQLVLKPYQDDFQIQLVNELVERFSIGGHTFVRLGADAPGRAAFYDVLVDGPVQALAAHYKKYTEHTTVTTIEGEITATTTYYLHKDGQYYPIKKPKDVVRLFPEHRAALRSYLQKNNEPEPEQAFIALVRYQAELAAAH